MNTPLTSRILVVDNFDSFTYNLVHLLRQLDVPMDVVRNNAIPFHNLQHYSHLLIGPGPGLPDEAGDILRLISTYKSSKSILGVCLGMQALLVEEGVSMKNLDVVQHGAQSILAINDQSRLFHSIPNSIRVGRYHSWAFEPENIPSSYQTTATSEDECVMAIEHNVHPLFGVQFHPESIMTSHGLAMMKNWLRAD